MKNRLFNKLSLFALMVIAVLMLKLNLDRGDYTGASVSFATFVWLICNNNEN